MIYRNYPRVKKKLIEEVHALATLLLFDSFSFPKDGMYIYIYMLLKSQYSIQQVFYVLTMTSKVHCFLQHL